MYRWLLFVCVFILSQTLDAQGQSILEPEVAVDGVITDEQPIRSYIFTVEANTPVIIELVADDPLYGLNAPTLRLKDATGAVLADTEPLPPTFGRFGSAYIATILTVGGAYTVDVSRAGGAEDSAQGRYQLILHLPSSLSANRIITAELQNTGAYHFYYYIGEQDFRVMYEKLGGSFAPEVGVYQAMGGALIGMGYLSGDLLSYGVLGTFSADEPYYIIIGPPTSALMTRQLVDGNAQVAYTLRVEAVQPED